MEITTDKRCKMHPQDDAELVLTPEYKHYGKFVCSKCQKFIVWAKSPKTNEAQLERKEQIMEYILNAENLSRSTLSFLLDISCKPHLNLVEGTRYENLLMERQV